MRAWEDGCVVAHVASSAEDVPRLVGLMSAIEKTGIFDQLVLDAGGGIALDAVLAEFSVRTPVISLDAPDVPDDVRGVLMVSGCSVVVLHVDDHAGLCFAIAAAQRGVALVRVGGVPESGAGRVIARLADVLLTRSPDDAVAQPNLIAPERSAVIGDPLSEVIRRHARAAHDRAAWRDVGAQPGGYVLSVLNEQAPDADIARAMDEIAAGQPVITLARAAGFLERLSLQRAARAIVTDSERVRHEAAMLGVPCHVVDVNRTLTAGIGSGPTPIGLWDARAGELAARALLANFAWTG